MDSARDWFLNDTSAGRWVNKNIVKPVKKKAKAVYNYLDEKVPVLTGIGEALYDEAKTITDSVDIVGKVIDVAKVITHPKEAIKQIGDNYKKILADPKAVWNSVANKVTNYVDTNIINGNAHTRAEFGTHAAVFIGSFFVGGSESKASTTASKFAESAKGFISKTNGLTNRIIYEETGLTNIFNKMFSSIAENKIPEVNRGLSGVGEGVTQAKPDFYVTPSGDAIPSTGYRYMSENAPYMKNLKESMTIPENPNGTYFSFNKYDIANPGALQVPHDAAYRASFDTLQVIDDIRVPNGKWGQARHLEPLTKDFPQFGSGGASQVITNKPITLDEITKLPRWLPSIKK
ncbi:hypothetical protein Clo1100_3377 [Clostridium sp. BNL1100]|nr:hypothetical protein Clo1100_3377 [Clostridium sp. BNL1100]